MTHAGLVMCPPRVYHPNVCSTCDGVLQYRYNPDQSMTEISPTHCRRGHVFRPFRVSVGYEHAVDGDGSAHRTYLCWACEEAGFEDATMRFEIPAREHGPFPT